MELRQRKLFITKQFTITETGLHAQVKTLFDFDELEIPFEELQLKRRIRRRNTSYLMLIITCFFGLGAVINLVAPMFGQNAVPIEGIIILFVLAAASFVFTYAGTKTLIIIPIQGNQQIEIFRNRPSQFEVDNFIQTLIDRSNSYFKKRYGTVDRDLPTEPQLANYSWLRDSGIITEQEFLQLKNELLGRRDGNSSIGFYHS